VAPSGSLIYQSSTSAGIAPTSDTDSFTIRLDAGQTLTALVVPATGLQPRVEVRDASGALIGSASSAAAGADAVAQTAAVSAAGTYTVTVGSLASTAGEYSLQLFLNAALESESHDGGSNETRATAQSLDGSFISLGPSASRGAVVGVGDASNAALPAEIEPNDSIAQANSAVANFAAYSGNLYHLGIKGAISTGTDADWFKLGPLDVGDVLTINQAAASSSRGTLSDSYLSLYRYNGGSPLRVAFDDDGGPGLDSLVYDYTVTTADVYYAVADAFSSDTGSYDLGLWLQNSGTPPATSGTLSNETEPNDSFATANDASTAWRLVQYRSQTTGTIASGDLDYYAFQFTAGDLVSVDVASTSSLNAKTWLRNGSGTAVALEDGTSTGPGNDSPIYAYRIPTTGVYYLEVGAYAGTGTYTANVYLSTTTPPPVPAAGGDYYSFTLSAGDRLTLGLMGLAAESIHLSLEDGAGTTLAAGVAGAANLTETISDFTVGSAGVYYACVTSSQALPYSLVITRNADFDTEPNDSLAAAQPISTAPTGHGMVLGSMDPAVATGVEPDDYPAGMTLTNAVPGITLSAVGDASPVTSQTSSYSSTGTQVFAYGTNIGWSDSVFLRADFAAPVSSVSIDLVPDDDYDPGFLKAYDSAGVLLEDLETAAPPFPGFLTMTISRPSADIAYVVAGDQSGQVVLLDHLVVNAGACGSDDYRISALAGQNISLATRTPGDGPGEFVNNLDPAIELYDPSGTLVASDDNGGPDGRNSLLDYVAPASGQYVVRVSGALGTSGEYVLDATIGAALPGGIHGAKWNDLNGNGQWDPGEPALAGWTIYLDANNNGQLDPGEISTVTDAAGQYAFDGVAPGAYQVCEVPQPGWVQTYPRAELSNGGFESGDLTGWSSIGSATVTTATFGTPPAEGAYQALLTDGSPSVPTSQLETFLNLAAGTLNSISSGPVIEGSALRRTLTVSAGDTVSFQWNFLTNESLAPPWTYNDFAFVSLTPVGLAATRLADTEFDAFLPSSGTGYSWETGYCQFQHAFTAAGTYLLGIGVVDVTDSAVNSAILLDSVQLTSGGNSGQRVVVGSGQVVAGVNFGNWAPPPAEIHGTEWNDLNGNGVRDPGEPPLAGWTVFLDTNHNGVLDPGEVFTTTAADGSYAFTDLPAGTYAVAAVTRPEWTQTFPGSPETNLILNGSFETGDFTGWTVSTPPNALAPWAVSAAGSMGSLDAVSPAAGKYDAWNGFDGGGPIEFTMYQDVSIPAAATATLAWQDRAQWAVTGQPRTLQVEVRDPVTNALLDTVDSFSTTGASGDTGWLSHSVDLSAYAGENVRIEFVESVPEYFTGPGQIEFDAIGLTASFPAGEHVATVAPGQVLSGVDFGIQPTTRVWDGGGKNDDLTTPANWLGDVAPVAGDRLVFAGSTQTSSYNDFAPDTVFQGIAFQGDGFSLSGNAATLDPQGGGAAIDNARGDNSVAIPLTVALGATAALVEGGTLHVSAASPYGKITGDVVDDSALAFDCPSLLAFAGSISGPGGVTEEGSGRLLFTFGGSTYTGVTNVESGALQIDDASSATNVLTNVNAAAHTGGTNVAGGFLVLDCSSDSVNEASLANTVQGLLHAAYNGGHNSFQAGRDYQLYSAAASNRIALGWVDNAATHQVTVMPALYGDANLDGVVDVNDLNTVLANYNQSGASWSQGDFNYDGVVGFADLNKVLTNYHRTGPLSINNLPALALQSIDGDSQALQLLTADDVTVSGANVAAEPPVPTQPVAESPASSQYVVALVAHHAPVVVLPAPDAAAAAPPVSSKSPALPPASDEPVTAPVSRECVPVTAWSTAATGAAERQDASSRGWSAAEPPELESCGPCRVAASPSPAPPSASRLAPLRGVLSDDSPPASSQTGGNGNAPASSQCVVAPAACFVAAPVATERVVVIVVNFAQASLDATPAPATAPEADAGAVHLRPTTAVTPWHRPVAPFTWAAAGEKPSPVTDVPWRSQSPRQIGAQLPQDIVFGRWHADLAQPSSKQHQDADGFTLQDGLALPWFSPRDSSSDIRPLCDAVFGRWTGMRWT
jgi:autotransporter-associated beta strand protein